MNRFENFPDKTGGSLGGAPSSARSPLTRTSDGAEARQDPTKVGFEAGSSKQTIPRYFRTKDLKNLPLHPLLFATFPVLRLYTHNQRQLLLNVLWIPLALSLVFALIIWFLAYLVFKNTEKAGLVTSPFLLLFFSYGYFHNFVGGKHLDVFSKLTLDLDQLLLPLSLATMALLAYFISQSKGEISLQTKILNLTAFFLVISTLGRLVPYELARKKSSPDHRWEKTTPILTDKTYPDVYYLVLDRYASAKHLKEFYSFDNSQFINFLTDKGFYVASESLTNYPKTYSSLASSLNMTHLAYLTEELGKNNSDLNPLFEMMQDFKVWRLLKQRGYRFIYFGNWWDHTQTNPHADLNITYRFDKLNLSEFSTKFLTSTVLYPLAKNLFFDSPSENPLNINYVQAKTTLYTFEKLAEIPELSGPKFVFVHLLVPHLPYVFGRNGEVFLEPRDLYTPKDYINQIIFVNKKIEEILETILAQSNPLPIIILQSDEGPFSGIYGNQGEEIDWTKLPDSDLRLHLGILNAYYLPDREAVKHLYPSITPINSFRVVFNFLLGTDYDLLEDTVYITPDTKHPYQFIDVTSRVGS